VIRAPIAPTRGARSSLSSAAGLSDIILHQARRAIQRSMHTAKRQSTRGIESNHAVSACAKTGGKIFREMRDRMSGPKNGASSSIAHL